MRMSFCLILSALLLTGCMKKQSHQISAPETPSYLITGFTLDIDTDEKLPQIQLIFRPDPEGMIFDCPLIDQKTISDDTAYFEIELCPGNYTLIAERDYFPVLEKRLTISKEDRKLDIQLPSVLATTVFHTFNNIQGFCRKNANTYAVVARVDAGGGSGVMVNHIFEGNFQSSFRVLGNNPSTNEQTELKGLIYANGFYYSGTGSLSNPQLAEINAISGQVVRMLPLTHRIVDLTFDGRHLWGIAPAGKIIRFDKNSTAVLNEYPGPGHLPSGIAWNGRQIFTCDPSAKHVFRHDSELRVEKTFRPIFFTSENLAVPINDFSFLEADSTGNLYLVKEDTIFCFILQIEILSEF